MFVEKLTPENSEPSLPLLFEFTQWNVVRYELLCRRHYNLGELGA